MHGASASSLDRVGAAAGATAVALLVVLLLVFPSLPAADEPIATIARDAAASEKMLLAGDYVGLVMGGLWLLFGVAVACRLRRAEPADMSRSWWIVCLAGITASAAVGLLGNLFSIMLVRAVGHGVVDDSLWTVYSGDLVGFVQAIPLALFMLGAGFGGRAVFPPWTALLALGTVPLLVVGAASVAGDEVDGSPFILPLLIAYLGMLVWAVVISAALWRGSTEAAPGTVPDPV